MTVQADLLDLFVPAVERFEGSWAGWLARLGVGKPAVLAAGGLGVARIEAGRDGIFSFCDSADGEAVNALVVGCWSRRWRAGEVSGGTDPRWWPELVDLAAWRPDAEWTCTLRGAAAWLGTDPGGVEPGAPFRLCATVHGWLRALDADPWAPAGVALDPIPGLTAPAAWARDGGEQSPRLLRDLLDGVAQVVCDDETHAAAVHKALRLAPKPRLPEVRFQRSAFSGQPSAIGSELKAESCRLKASSVAP